MAKFPNGMAEFINRSVANSGISFFPRIHPPYSGQKIAACDRLKKLFPTHPTSLVKSASGVF